VAKCRQAAFGCFSRNYITRYDIAHQLQSCQHMLRFVTAVLNGFHHPFYC
jgi:hypothetical protein